MIYRINTRKKSVTSLFSRHWWVGHPEKMNRFRRNHVFDQRGFPLFLIGQDSTASHSVSRIFSVLRYTSLFPPDRQGIILNRHRLYFVILSDYRTRHWTNFLMIVFYPQLRFSGYPILHRHHFPSRTPFPVKPLPVFFAVRSLLCFPYSHLRIIPVSGAIRRRSPSLPLSSLPLSSLPFFPSSSLVPSSPSQIYSGRKRDSPRFLYLSG